MNYNYDIHFGYHGKGSIGYPDSHNILDCCDLYPWTTSVEDIVEALSFVKVSRGSRNSRLHTKIKIERNWTCGACGDVSIGDPMMYVHHIGSVWDDRRENLMVLCPPCREEKDHEKYMEERVDCSNYCCWENYEGHIVPEQLTDGGGPYCELGKVCTLSYLFISYDPPACAR